MRKSGRQLDRRTMLRGMGTAMSLPWLEAMVPGGLSKIGSSALAASTAATTPLRTAFVFIPNGVDPEVWHPTGDGRDYQLSSSLAPLAPLREKFSVLSGLAHHNAKALGDGPGDHARSARLLSHRSPPVQDRPVATSRSVSPSISWLPTRSVDERICPLSNLDVNPRSSPATATPDIRAPTAPTSPGVPVGNPTSRRSGRARSSNASSGSVPPRKVNARVPDACERVARYWTSSDPMPAVSMPPWGSRIAIAWTNIARASGRSKDASR